MPTTLNLSSLPEYVKQNADELLIKAATSAKTLEYISTRLNVKNKESINMLDSTVTLQDGKNCGFNPTGSDTFTQRIIELVPIKINKEWCPMDFRKYYMNHQLQIAAGREKLPFEEKLIESNLNEIKEALEKLIWQGNDDLGLEGFIGQMALDSSVQHVNLQPGSTATQIIEATYAAIPESALERGKVYIFVNPTVYRSYISEQNATCCANREIIDAAKIELPYLGDTRVSIVPISGMAGDKRAEAIATWGDNLVYGTDIEDSEAIYDLWFSRDADVFRLKVLFNAGTQYLYPSEIVMTNIVDA